MRYIKSFSLLTLAGAFCATLALAADTPKEYVPNVKADEQKLIDAAMPTQAIAKPAKTRKLLVYVESKGYYHDSIPIAAYALKKMGEKTGAFEAYITDDDVTTWNLDTLKQYDGIFMDNTVGEHPKTDQGKKDFVEYIKSGHGLMGCHAAADCNHPWAEYQEMLGGEFAGHPWGKVSVKLDDPDSPINKVFEGKGFVINEEIYTFKMTTDKRKEGYGRDKQHVLLSVDMDASGLKDTTRKDGDYALAWIKEYGQGRVFYCAFGHAHDHFYNPILLQYYLAGIQYALGDLKADATPSAKLNPAPKAAAGGDMKGPTINPKRK